MKSNIADQLTDYYLQKGIHPEDFHCKHQSFCRSYANQGRMTEAKMSMVGSQYGLEYPKIAVVSLDPPSGESGRFALAHQRTTSYIASSHEKDNFDIERPNPHWAMTHIIVRNMLTFFGFRGKPGAAVVEESYSGRSIENVAAYFAHVNVAKCSMNNPGQGQANKAVHDVCGKSYLMQELSILTPDFLITQGKQANSVIAMLFNNHKLLTDGLPNTFRLQFGNKPALWIPMRHPSRQIGAIRKEWHYYAQAIQNWESK